MISVALDGKKLLALMETRRSATALMLGGKTPMSTVHNAGVSANTCGHTHRFTSVMNIITTLLSDV